MWFLNKETGLAWEIEDQELIQRLLGNANYEQLEEPDKVQDEALKVTENKKRAGREQLA